MQKEKRKAEDFFDAACACMGKGKKNSNISLSFPAARVAEN
jgi:hypothetical protein